MMLAAASAPAQQVPLAEAAKMFGTRPSGWGAELSPSGRKIAYLGSAGGTETRVFLLDLDTNKVTPILASTGKPDSIQWCEFASETRLVCLYGGNSRFDTVIASFSRLVTVRTDGQDLKSLGRQDSVFDAYVRQFDGAVLDWLPEQQGSILMARTYVPQNRVGATRLGDRRQGVGVDRIDLETLRSTSIEDAKDKIANYMTDGRGVIRISAIDQMSGTQLTGVRNFHYRPKAGGDWRPLGSFDSTSEEGIWPQAIDRERDSVYALSKLHGRYALYRMPLDGSGAKALVASHPKVDIDGIALLDRGHLPIGYTYTDERRHLVYFDPEYQKLAASLAKVLPATPLIEFASASKDAKTLLVHASADTDPGAFYLLDRTTKQMKPVLVSRALLEGRKLSPVKSVTLPAADGTLIPGYLTLPLQPAAKGKPAVVLPHGGPSARDEWGFDWLAQFLAARGYAVIQPNYRGSAGYGDAFLGENAFRDWRLAMSDIGASAKYLIDNGIADADRLAIVGWSYGGYAALQSATLEPDRYKAVVAIAPVTDLASLKSDAAGFTDARLTRQFIGSGDHVSAGSPLQNVARIKAPVLLVHGDLDNNVRVTHSQKMHDSLVRAGTPVELLRYKELEHQLDSSDARVEMLGRMGALLDRTIGR